MMKTKILHKGIDLRQGNQRGISEEAGEQEISTKCDNYDPGRAPKEKRCETAVNAGVHQTDK
jgi:hypothetical protein